MCFYIYLKEKRLVGLVVIEEVKQRQIRQLSNWEEQANVDTECKNDQSEDLEIVRNDIHSDDTVVSPKPFWMGVKILWVHQQMRKAKIATKLIDVARQVFVFGQIVEKAQVAFSQPTFDGFNFAKYYCNSVGVNCY
jgi:N-acetyltransferase